MLAPWKKSYDKLKQHSKKQRHHFANEDACSQSYGFFCSHVWMWKWTIKKARALKNWCFWSVVLEKTLENPLDYKETGWNQSILKEISPRYSLEGLLLKLKIQSFSHLMQRTDSFEKTLMLGKTEGWRRRGWQRMRMRWLDGITSRWTWVWISSGVDDRQESLACHRPWITKNWTWLMTVLSWFYWR